MTAAVVDAPALSPVELSAARASWVLVGRVQAGEREVFGEIYNQYRDKVSRFLNRHGANRTLVEDLTSETFFRALKAIDTFTWQGRDFGAVLMRIAHNALLDHIRARRTRCEWSSSLNPAEMVPGGEVEAPDDTEGAAIAHLANLDLLAALMHLPVKYQDVLILRFLQGLTLRETADILGRSLHAVKMQQAMALVDLGAILPEGFER